MKRNKEEVVAHRWRKV